MYIADRLRITGTGAKQGNLPMRVEVLFKNPKDEKLKDDDNKSDPEMPLIEQPNKASMPTRKRVKMTVSYSCQFPECSACYPSKKELHQHFKTHCTLKTGYRCAECTDVNMFESKNALQKHMREVHQASKRPRN